MAAILLLSSLSYAIGIQSSSPSPTATPTPAPAPTPAAESPKAPQRLRVSSGVAEGLLRHKVEPVYPLGAREYHIQGNVLLQIVIDRQGNLASVKVLQGHPLLADASMDAVKQWKYKPYLLNGEPVEVESTVLIRFHM